MKSSQLLTTIVFLSVLIEIELQKEIPACGLRGRPTVFPTMINSYPTRRWPWHAAIYHIDGEMKYQCGGTVITSDSILTAAHCVHKYGYPMKKTQIIVSLGRLTLSANESSAREFKVNKIFVHSEFILQPICLWKSNMSEVIGKSGTVIGWGITETGNPSNELRQASLPVLPWTTCLKKNSAVDGTYLSEHKFCAGSRNGTGICRGDSGGSMTFEEHGNYYIRGIISSSQSFLNSTTKAFECDTAKYGYFTDVAHFLPWIEDKSDMDQQNLSSCQDFCGRDADSNRICPEFDLGMEWSPAGPIRGKNCTQVIEPRDLDAWLDNYICFNKDYGVRWSPAGTIAGMNCERIIEVVEPIEHTWHDNFLCVPYDSAFQFKWSPNGVIAGLCCIQMYEPRDIHTWHDNYLCVSR